MNFFHKYISFKILLAVTLLVGASGSCWGMKEAHLALLPEEYQTFLSEHFGNLPEEHKKLLTSLPENLTEQHETLLQKHVRLLKEHADLQEENASINDQIKTKEEELKKQAKTVEQKTAEEMQKEIDRLKVTSFNLGKDISTKQGTLDESLKKLKEAVPQATKKAKAAPKATEEAKKQAEGKEPEVAEVPGVDQVIATLKRDAKRFALTQGQKLLLSILGDGAITSAITAGLEYLVSQLVGDKNEQAALKTLGDHDKAMLDDVLAGKAGAGAGPGGVTAKKEDDDVYNQTLSSVAALFAGIDKEFKSALIEQSTYSAKKFTIKVGTIKINDHDTDVSIEYDFEQDGAGDLGLPFVPFIVTISPETIHGFTITPEDLLSKMSKGAAKDLTSLLLQPTASLIFAIKLIQLVNSGIPSELQEDAERAEYLLDQTSGLYSRLLLSPEADPNPATLLSSLPKVIQDVMKEKKVIMYSNLIADIYTPLKEQKTAFEECKPEFEEGTMIDALSIFYNNAHQLFNRKFVGDDGYTEFKGTIKHRATKNYLLAIFYRGLRELSKATKTIGSSGEDSVTLRRLDGTEYVINPKLAIQGLLKTPQKTMEAATGKLKDAVSMLRKIVDTAKETKEAPDAQKLADAKTAYTQAIAATIDANKLVGVKMLEFRKIYGPYYPLLWNDGEKRTPAEFLVASIKELMQHSNLIKKEFITPIYKPFKKNFGLTEVQLLGVPVSQGPASAVAPSSKLEDMTDRPVAKIPYRRPITEPEPAEEIKPAQPAPAIPRATAIPRAPTIPSAPAIPPAPTMPKFGTSTAKLIRAVENNNQVLIQSILDTGDKNENLKAISQILRTQKNLDPEIKTLLEQYLVANS